MGTFGYKNISVRLEKTVVKNSMNIIQHCIYYSADVIAQGL